ncbi:hypothetical protein FRC04_006946 [Tulasnella sp. 424]|nr:hypothetical protein FRC04_006946 [Tulasnella sp. 424]KAG8960299.1 hypothetical protein FRC05_006983 [Tulasnella sp. 425]
MAKKGATAQKQKGNAKNNKGTGEGKAGKRKATQLPSSKPEDDGTEEHDDNQGATEDNTGASARPSRERKRSARGLESDDYQQRQPYQRNPTKSPEKRPATTQRTQGKRKALEERSNAFTFTDQPPAPLKKVKLMEGVGVPAKGTSQAPTERPRSSAVFSAAPSTLRASNSGPTPGPTARPKSLQDPQTHATIAANTAAHRRPRFPEWATPLARPLPAAPARLQPEQRVPPLGVSRPNLNRPAAPGPQPQHVSDPIFLQGSNHRAPAQVSRSSDPGQCPQVRTGQDDAGPMAVDPPLDVDKFELQDDPWADVDDGAEANHQREQTRPERGEDNGDRGQRVDRDRDEDDEADGEQLGGGEDDDNDEGEDDDEEDNEEEEDNDEEDNDDDNEEDNNDEEDDDDEDDEGRHGGHGVEDVQPEGSRQRQRKKGTKQGRRAVVKKASAFGGSVAPAIQMVCRFVRSTAITKFPMASIEEEGNLIRKAWPVVMQLKPFRGQNLPWKEEYYATVR